MLLELVVIGATVAAAIGAWLTRKYLLREPLKIWIAVVAFFPLVMAIPFAFEQLGLSLAERFGPAFEAITVSTALFIILWILASKKIWDVPGGGNARDDSTPDQ
jgi:hypothetical protein